MDENVTKDNVQKKLIFVVKIKYTLSLKPLLQDLSLYFKRERDILILNKNVDKFTTIKYGLSL